MVEKIEKYEILGAQIIFKNFGGVESTYNRKGNCNFHAVLTDQSKIDELLAVGFNIKMSEDEEKAPILKVNVTNEGARFVPPIYVVNERLGTKTLVKKEDFASLDNIEIKFCDMQIRKYAYDVGKNKGVSAYLSSMFIVLMDDDFSNRYSNLGGLKPANQDPDFADVPF